MNLDTLFLFIASAEADRFAGATAPNPPVGACVVREAKLLAVGAHERAGTAHAEVVAIQKALEKFGTDALRDATLYVTLEPCNHFGKTPPCTTTILKYGIRSRCFRGHGSQFPRQRRRG